MTELQCRYSQAKNICLVRGQTVGNTNTGMYGYPLY